VGGKQNSLYDAAVKYSTEYLGPAGERFLRRQISMHLSIEPEDLTPKDLEKLINWVRLAFAMLTDNQRHIEEFIEDLNSLTAKSLSKNSRNGYAKH
jgi:hypothetical protein